MNRKIVLIGILTLFIPVGALAQTATQEPPATDLQKQLQEMRLEVIKLQTRLADLEASKPVDGTKAAVAPAPTPDAATIPQGPTSRHVGDATANYETFSEDSVAAARFNNVPLDPKYHGYFRLPGTQTFLKIGGFFKTDFMYDVKRAGNPDEFIPSSIPIPQIQGVRNSNLSIRATRLSLDFRIPSTQLGDVRFYVESDLFGDNSTTPRLRHAYAQVRNVLLGQTWTNFMDPDAAPDTLDFQGPTGYTKVRSPQFRYTFAVAKRTTMAVSVEKPSSDIEFKTPQFSSQPNSPSPDGTVRVRQEFQRGHWQVASLFRSIAAFLPDGRTGSVFGWGVNASGAVRVFGKDNVVVEGTYGHGVSRYIQDAAGLGIDAAVISTANPHLKATPALGAEAGYQHYWNKSLRSNLVYGHAQVQNTGFQPKSTYHKSEYTAANLIWNPFGSLNVGAEFLYGRQVLKSGQTGNAPRIQFSAKYTFVKIDRDKK
ncbi:MAG TPA: DcaP family trimeric outer membrane transporter [Candidatus Acidoferrum sp.]|nr:DcaP family trimeric outer membrane transporter [Candidatus Acidoferrum sp.]